MIDGDIKYRFISLLDTTYGDFRKAFRVEGMTKIAGYKVAYHQDLKIHFSQEDLAQAIAEINFSLATRIMAW